MGLSLIALSQIGLATAAVGTIASIVQGRKAAKSQKAAAGEQRKARAAQQKIAEIKNLREQRQLIRQGRIKRAEVLQAGVTQTGGVTSTAVAGGAASVTTQTGAGGGFRSAILAGGGEVNQFLETASIFESQAISSSNQAATFGAIASLGSSIFTSAGKISSATGGPGK